MSKLPVRKPPLSKPLRPLPRLTATDHDRLFKQLLTTFFHDFLRRFLPDVAAAIDPASIVFLDKELITDLKTGKKHIADLVVKVRWRGQTAFFLIHVENQAKSQPDFPERMFLYFARLYERHRVLIFPVAILSFDQPQRADPDRFTMVLHNLPVLDFRYHAIQLDRLDWRDFLNQPNPVAAALMAKMNIAPQDRPRAKLECLRMIATLRLDPARTQLLSSFVDSYLELNRAEAEQFQAELGKEPPQEQEEVMDIVEKVMRINQLRREWEEYQRGHEEGRQEGEAKMVLRQLQRRLGPVTRTVQGHVKALPLEELEELGEALLDFSSRDDLKAWLAAHPVEKVTRRVKKAAPTTKSAAKTA
jgi:Domain of unknown function (DUF4351)/Putative transposase, YhgA-like